MNRHTRWLAPLILLAFAAPPARADKYDDTIKAFRNAGEKYSGLPSNLLTAGYAERSVASTYR